MDLYLASEAGDLERVQILVEQGVDKEKIGGVYYGHTPLYMASSQGHLSVVRYLVEQGADLENPDREGWTPLIVACINGKLEVVRYLLEQGANRDKASEQGWTSLHYAAHYGRLEIAKLLMSYGADLNARDINGELPIDIARTEEIKQAIRDEPRRRMDHGHKRATEQDRHLNTAVSVTVQQEGGGVEAEQSDKRPRLDEGTVAEEGKVAEEDEDSEPSDEEDD